MNNQSKSLYLSIRNSFIIALLVFTGSICYGQNTITLDRCIESDEELELDEIVVHSIRETDSSLVIIVHGLANCSEIQEGTFYIEGNDVRLIAISHYPQPEDTKEQGITISVPISPSECDCCFQVIYTVDKKEISFPYNLFLNDKEVD